MTLAAAAIGASVLGAVVAHGVSGSSEQADAQDVPAVQAVAEAHAIPAPPVLKSEYFLALTMYHEARGQSPQAMKAVGWVVMNRARSDGFPDGIHDVVTEPTRSGKCQFGWACGDLSVDKVEPAAWQQAEALAGDLLFHGGRDPTKGAVWFWESWRPRPDWLGRNARETLELGGHSFYAPTRLPGSRGV
jgi:spore germination cell wall hydrolase CwlJ-like protein